MIILIIDGVGSFGPHLCEKLLEEGLGILKDFLVPNRGRCARNFFKFI